MKWLTVSMPDELFDKLDSIGNKSLFIRKILERELEMPSKHPETNIAASDDIVILKQITNDLNKRINEIECQLSRYLTEAGEDEKPMAPDIENAYQPLVEDTIASSHEFTTDHEVQEDNMIITPVLKPTVETADENPIVIPELKLPVKTTDENSVNMPVIKTQVEMTDENPIVVPVIKTQVEMTDENPIVVPVIKTQVEMTDENPIVVPVLKSEVEMTDENPIVVPVLKSEVEMTDENSMTIPELEAPGKMANEAPVLIPDFGSIDKNHFEDPEQKDTNEVPFSLPGDQTTQRNENLPPIYSPAIPTKPREIMQSPTSPDNHTETKTTTQDMTTSSQFDNAPQQVKNDRTRNDKLESNILMYMPHGAKVKKNIIKSLVSKKFTDYDFEAKIQEMFSKQLLDGVVEESVEYLIRP